MQQKQHHEQTHLEQVKQQQLCQQAVEQQLKHLCDLELGAIDAARMQRDVLWWLPHVLHNVGQPPPPLPNGPDALEPAPPMPELAPAPVPNHTTPTAAAMKTEEPKAPGAARKWEKDSVIERSCHEKHTTMANSSDSTELSFQQQSAAMSKSMKNHEEIVTYFHDLFFPDGAEKEKERIEKVKGAEKMKGLFGSDFTSSRGPCQAR